MKKFLCALLVLLFTLGMSSAAFAEPTPMPAQGSDSAVRLIKYKDIGEEVVRIQLRLRDLCYFNYKPTGNFQNMTVEATIKFQQLQVDANGQTIIADGTVGEQSMAILFGTAAKRNSIDASIPFGQALQGEPVITGQLVNWGEVSQLLEAGVAYTITDYNTGVTFKMKFVGGENHAEMECATAQDATIYRDAFGGEYNYSKRPVVIDINGRQVAASLQGCPHGEDTIPGNDMDGHSCLFFDGSLSHVGSLPDVEHLNQIYRAAGRS